MIVISNEMVMRQVSRLGREVCLVHQGRELISHISAFNSVVDVGGYLIFVFDEQYVNDRSMMTK